MTTPRVRSLVSLAAALTITLGASACARGLARSEADGPTPVNAPLPAVRFENASLDYVHVYLVGVWREWPLGRVAPSATVALRIPEDALDQDEGQMRLAVVAGDGFRPTGVDARVITPLAKPMAEILNQRWTFTQRPTYGELTPLPLGRARSAVRVP